MRFAVLWMPRSFVCAAAALAAFPASAATFEVRNAFDGIPAPPGSLRAAVEASEANGEPDVIVFAIDGGTIDLVAALPDLREGGLRIQANRPDLLAPPAANPVLLRGANGVERAFWIVSSGNAIVGLDFADFSGPEVIRIEGGAANHNEISGCVFGADVVGGTAGAAIRVTAPDGDPAYPTGTTIQASRFVGNGSGLALEASTGVAVPTDAWTRVTRCGFGTAPSGGPGAGNERAIVVSNGGRIEIEESRFSGPGAGILLGPGAGGSRLVGNEIGVLGSAADVCAGFHGAAVEVDRSTGLTIVGNRIRCSGGGVHLRAGSDGAELHDNEIGGPSPAGHAGNGVTVDTAGSVVLRRNRISGNAGFGVQGGPVSSTDPPELLLACNAVWRNGAGAIALSTVEPLPPAITEATIVSVQGDVTSTGPGWVEVFGDVADQAAVFQGAVRLRNDSDPSFRHRLPVLDLRMKKLAVGAVISFDRAVPTNHTATFSAELLHRTSALSDPTAAATAGLAFDVIRGDLANLAFGPAGIDLGPVRCLAAGMDPDPTVTPDVVDPENPAPGEGFFYLSRRRTLDANVLGTYDPAMCLTEVDAFRGPRLPASGDCE
jgi:hypothetical protein